jgi:predicted branched-subunit amino acid permease
MTTTISKPTRRSYTNRPARSPNAHRLRRARSRPSPGGSPHDSGATVEATSSPASALVSGARAILPVLLALLPFGVAFGASATESGLSALEALGMSVFIAAGAAQLAALPLLSAGASVAVVVLTVLVINLRLMLYSASLAPHFRRLPLGWKGLISYHLTDQAYAATITRFDAREAREPDKRWYFLGVALSIWTTWQAATMTGVFLGAWASEGSPSLLSRIAPRGPRPCRPAWLPSSAPRFP